MVERSEVVYDDITFVGHPVNAFNLIKSWWNPVTPHPPGSQGNGLYISLLVVKVTFCISASW